MTSPIFVWRFPDLHGTLEIRHCTRMVHGLCSDHRSTSVIIHYRCRCKIRLGARERVLHGIPSAVGTLHQVAYRNREGIPRAHRSLDAPFHVNAPLFAPEQSTLTRDKATTSNLDLRCRPCNYRAKFTRCSVIGASKLYSGAITTVRVA